MLRTATPKQGEPTKINKPQRQSWIKIIDFKILRPKDRIHLSFFSFSNFFFHIRLLTEGGDDEGEQAERDKRYMGEYTVSRLWSRQQGKSLQWFPVS